MISLSVLDSNNKELQIHSNEKQPIELIIPRDPNFIVPEMTFYNVTLIQDSKEQFYFHVINITQLNENFSVSFHLEMRPNNPNLNYLLIMKLDAKPQLNSAINNIDNWSTLCSSGEYCSLIDLN